MLKEFEEEVEVVRDTKMYQDQSLAGKELQLLSKGAHVYCRQLTDMPKKEPRARLRSACAYSNKKSKVELSTTS